MGTGRQMVIFSIFVLTTTYAQTLNHELGDVSIKTCRSSTINSTWAPPVRGFGDVAYAQLSFVPKQNMDNANQEIIIKYINAGGPWVFSPEALQYKGRLFIESLTEIELQDTQITDSGMYTMNITTSDDAFYTWTMDLIVYEERNVWPRSIIPIQSPNQVVTVMKTYTFERHVNSPVVDVTMHALAGDGRTSADKHCSFRNLTRCDITFGPADYEGLYGTLQMVVDPHLQTGTPQCVHTFKPFYNLIISVPPPPGITTSGIVGIAVMTLVVVVLVIVVPAIFIRYRESQKHCLSLQEGVPFVKYCIGVIESYTNIKDLRGVYVHLKPMSQIHHFIEVYKQSKGQPDEDYRNEKVLISSALLTFLTEEKTPWLPVEFQQDVSQGNTDKYLMPDMTFDPKRITPIFGGTTTKADNARSDIIRELILHLHRLSGILETAPQNRKSKIPVMEEVMENVSGALFKEAIKRTLREQSMSRGQVEEIGMMTQQRHYEAQEHSRFLKLLVEHGTEVFASDQ